MNRWTKAGLIGTVITAICCFTPLLVWVFAAIGLGGLGGLGGLVIYLDIVLLPLLAVFVIVLIRGLMLRRRV